MGRFIVLVVLLGGCSFGFVRPTPKRVANEPTPRCSSFAYPALDFVTGVTLGLAAAATKEIAEGEDGCGEPGCAGATPYVGIGIASLLIVSAAYGMIAEKSCRESANPVVSSSGDLNGSVSSPRIFSAALQLDERE